MAAAALWTAGGLAHAQAQSQSQSKSPTVSAKSHGADAPPSTGDSPGNDARSAGTSASHAGAKSQATRGGTRSPQVGPASNTRTANGANADVGNSTGTAADERMPHEGTPRR